MKFQVYYAVEHDGRAREFVVLSEDCEYGGEVEARDKKSLLSLLMNPPDDSELDSNRPLQVGDVVVDEMEEAWIFTPSGVFALITVSEN